jgi:hypothetical protein
VRSEGSNLKTHRCRAACATHFIGTGVDNIPVVERLSGDIGDSAAISAAQITKLQSKNGSGQVTAENELVQPLIHGVQLPEEGGNAGIRIFLVVRARKKVRKAASRKAHPFLGA